MRKYYPTRPGPWVFSLCVIVALFLMVGCVTLGKTQKTVVLNLAAQNCGFLLAQENLPLALEIRDYSRLVLEMSDGDFTESTFRVWTGRVMESLKLDPLLEANFGEMVKLVNVEIGSGEDYQEIVKLLYVIIENFVIGIQIKK